MPLSWFYYVVNLSFIVNVKFVAYVSFDKLIDEGSVI